MTPAAPSLLESAVRRLALGPAHTLVLAREVMGLTGPPGPSAQAVFTLLGSDPRFGVDAEGVWVLRGAAPDPGGIVPLARARFAVVDVETTGGAFTGGDRVTDIAIVHVEDGTVGEAWHSLVNPGRTIPPWVQGLTGITDGMVRSAPPFEGVAPQVERRLRGRTFVAHNAGFDWRFVHGEMLAAAGDLPDAGRLCTVRLARLLLPRLRSHGLDALTAHYRIPIEGRHRALGDALATARLLLHLFREAEARGIRDMAGLEQALGGGGIPGGRRGGRARRASPGPAE